MITKRIWLSNTRVQDVPKIKRTFPFVVEGAPQAHGKYTVEDLASEQIVGLYKEEEVAE